MQMNAFACMYVMCACTCMCAYWWMLFYDIMFYSNNYNIRIYIYTHVLLYYIYNTINKQSPILFVCFDGNYQMVSIIINCFSLLYLSLGGSWRRLFCQRTLLAILRFLSGFNLHQLLKQTKGKFQI